MSEMDCDQVLEMVWGYLDGEVDEEEYRDIHKHIKGCGECGPRYEFQRKLMVLVERKCREGPIPVELKQRLFRLLKE
jgi:mycothiol system anti-sigma-R factor